MKDRTKTHGDNCVCYRQACQECYDEFKTWQKSEYMKKGDTITLIVKTPVADVEEQAIIEKITDKEIFIEGLSGSFNRFTGQKKDTFVGSKCIIKF